MYDYEEDKTASMASMRLYIKGSDEAPQILIVKK